MHMLRVVVCGKDIFEMKGLILGGDNFHTI